MSATATSPALSAWLDALGLGSYATAFDRHGVSVDVLPHLTLEDLRSIGVEAVGHRRKLMVAIEALSRDPATLPTIGEVGGPERRQLTVIFCDLVGSTALSARLDPEDMGGVLWRFHAAVAEAAARYGGHVAKLMGDGDLVYFGYPLAHEDDPERAAHAGLALVDAVRSIVETPGGALAVRIGIATGVVVVGELMGEGEARERGVVGDTPNLAARLQALAEPNAVVVADATRGLLGGAFEVRDLGCHALKGLAEPVRAWAVEREAAHVSRFEAARARGRTPFVGRAQEIALLADRWREAVAGEGQVVLLSGEAGIGKSRIVETFRDGLVGTRHARLVFQCSPHRGAEAFHPVLAQLRRSARLAPGEAPASALGKIESLVLACPGVAPNTAVPLLARLLSVPADARFPMPDLSPGEAKERLVSSLVALVLALARDRPVFALLEDAHWIDASSRDLFGRLALGLAAARVLLVVTVRPEGMPPWAGHPHVTLHGLNHLGRRQAMEMVGGASGGRALPPDVAAAIVDRTDGVPLFIEELTRSIIESGALRPAERHYVRAAPDDVLDIPATLHDSLMARIDRLGPVKEVAQVGACIGRHFSRRLLEAVAPAKGPGLDAALAVLEEAGLVHGRGTPAVAVYTFKHALIQNAAYASLVRSRRRAIHAAIARALDEPGFGLDEAGPAVAARHYAEAGLAEPAARAWLAAAEAALAASADAEAAATVEAALAVAPRIADPAARREVTLALLFARVSALTFVKGLGAPETCAALQEAGTWLEAGPHDDLQRMNLLHGLGLSHYIEARMGPALAFARHYLDLAERQPDPIYRLVGHAQLGTVLLLRGELGEALAQLDRALLLRSSARPGSAAYRFVWEPGIATLCMARWTLLALGRHDRAREMMREIDAERARHSRPFTIAYCWYLGDVFTASLLSDLDVCERRSAELLAFCDARGVDEFGHQARLRLACTRALRDPSAANMAALPAALGSHWASPHVSDSYNLSQHAEVLLAAGDLGGAESLLARAFAFVEASEERHWLADLHRLAGRIERARPVPDVARACASFAAAIAVARSQGAAMAELRAASALTELRLDLGYDDPGASLPAILAAIEGGDETHDVRAARALLDRIARGAAADPALTPPRRDPSSRSGG